MPQVRCFGRRRTLLFVALLPLPMAALAAAGGCNALAALLAPRPAASQPADSVRLVTVMQGLTAPVAMAIPPDNSGRFFVVDQIGLIRVQNADGTTRDAPFLDLRSRMIALGIDFGGGLVYDERGLLGLAFHPNYAANGRFYVLYTAPRGPSVPADFDSENHLSEFHVSAGDPNAADAASERILLTIPKPQFNHNGGQLAFGPDGFLYLSTGDGGNANDAGTGHTPDLGNAQDKSSLLGKFLRFDMDHGNPYAIPPDNPFVTDPAARPEIYAFGLRNPWRFSFDSQGSHRLFVADVGQNLFEEVDIISRGGNYGWHIREGDHCFDPANPNSPPAQCPRTGAGGEPLVEPILAYPHADANGNPVGIAAVGGYVYHGSALSALQNKYVFGDWSTAFIAADGSVFVAEEGSAGNWSRRPLNVADTADGRIHRFVLAFGQDAAGEVYVLSSANVGPLGATGRVDRLAAP